MALWVDTDMGFDDLMAIMLLKHAGQTIDGLSLVAGNTPIEQVERNMVAAARCFGWPEPIHSGAAQPIKADPETACAVLGETGMQSVGRRLPVPNSSDMRTVSDIDAVSALSSWLNDQKKPAQILALGPLTNIAELLTAHPGLADRISQLVWMGGSATVGNHTKHAEFNAYLDPEAIDIVLNAGLPLQMVGLDVCRTVCLTIDDITAIRTANGGNARLLADLLEGYVRIAVSRGRDAMALYDPTAAAVLADPNVLSLTPARMHIHPTGTLRRGMTEIEPSTQSSANIQLARHADSARVRSLTLHALQAEADR